MVNTAGTIWSIDGTMETPLRVSLAKAFPTRRINVLSPNPPASMTSRSAIPVTEAWWVGSVHLIRWAHNLGPTVVFAIELSRDGGLTWNQIGSVKGAAFMWRVNCKPSSSAMLRVRSGAGFFAVSPVFNILTAE